MSTTSACVAVEIAPNPSRDSQSDGLSNALTEKPFPSLEEARSFIQNGGGCSHLLYSAFAEALGYANAELWVDMGQAKRAKEQCEGCTCTDDAGEVARQDGVNSAAVMLTKDFETGLSAFDPSSSGGKKELCGSAFLLLPTRPALTAARVKGILLFIAEILPTIQDAGLGRAEKKEVIDEEIAAYKDGVWQPDAGTMAVGDIYS